MEDLEKMFSEDEQNETRQQSTKESIADAERLLVGGLPGVVGAVVHLARHAESEKLRFEAGRYIIDRCLGDGKGDPTKVWEDLMDRIAVKRG